MRMGWDVEPVLIQDGVSRNSRNGDSHLQHSMECQHPDKEDLHTQTMLQQSALDKQNFGDERKQQGWRS